MTVSETEKNNMGKCFLYSDPMVLYFWEHVPSCTIWIKCVLEVLLVAHCLIDLMCLIGCIRPANCELHGPYVCFVNISNPTREYLETGGEGEKGRETLKRKVEYLICAMTEDIVVILWTWWFTTASVVIWQVPSVQVTGGVLLYISSAVSPGNSQDW